MEPKGNIDGISNGVISGWAYDPDEPSKSITIHVYVDGPVGNGRVVGSATANKLRNDVNAAYGISGNHGFGFTIPSELLKGYRKFYVYAIDSQGGVNPLVAGSPKENGVRPTGNMSISKSVLGSELKITAMERFGGAIGSLTWKGVEFVDIADHGRQLQSACHFDDEGECYNPTEAGSMADGTKQTSTSEWQYGSNEGGALKTQSRMAFWLSPGGVLGGGCVSGRVINTAPVSNFIFGKEIKIGYDNWENVIEYDVNFWVAEDHGKGVFEILTGYMPIKFNKFYAFDKATKSIKSIVSGGSDKPVIQATADGSLAMGIYTPWKQLGVRGTDYYAAYYSVRDFSDVSVAATKWNVAMHNMTAKKGNYAFKNFVIVGSLEEVVKTMGELMDFEESDLEGDANGDGKVDLEDFVIWRGEYTGVLNTKRADFNGDGKVDLGDFVVWRGAYVGN